VEDARLFSYNLHRLIARAMNRRTFLNAGTLAACATLAGYGTVFAADTEIEILTAEPGVIISPHLYGHFIEHLGGVIYDGVWVGRDSSIPNIDGIRKQLVDDMTRIGAPNLRWPGGCFADGYHWRDGIGKSSARPRTYNFWQSRMPTGLDASETNQFGIHEFMHLCRLVGAEPYVAANVGSGTPKEFHDWVSYCNAPAGTVSLADERAANGDRDPFGIRYWGVGNESWGCGGAMRPEEYAAKYRQFVTQFPGYKDPFLVATGPRGHSADGDIGWTTGFFEGMRGATLPHGFSLHFYTDLRPTPLKAGSFDAREWYEVLLRGVRLNKVIEDHWNEMGKFDAAHRTKLVVDEWGVWYAPGSEITPAYILSETITLRDAIHTGLTFDIFNRHADKIAMANVAQMVNCIHSLFLAQGDKFVRTPVYHVFDMYRSHMGARQVPVRHRVSDLNISPLAGQASLPGLSASASVRDRLLTVTMTNPSLAADLSLRLRLTGGIRANEARARILTHQTMNGTNTFSLPEEVKPAAHPVKIAGNALELRLPKQAIVAVECEMSV
jgi:alpha-N-arabinofuranosidase